VALKQKTKTKTKKVADFEKIVAVGRVSAPLFLMLQKGPKSGGTSLEH
jgi:hypothetical protein